jgi:undecaprenyl diphosphate synthase
MLQSPTASGLGAGLHVAIIMDGNGRWATQRGLPRVMGHRAGAKAVRRVVEAARRLDVEMLTVYAFSSDNWQRPSAEVSMLMRLFEIYLHGEQQRCIANGIRLTVVGRRDRLAPGIQGAIERAESVTAAATGMHLRIAVDYSARDLIVDAATRLSRQSEISREAFAEQLAEAMHSQVPARDVDLLIRTGGEQRLSDFLLWECAYAELYFTPRMWPDFAAADLEQALREFRARDRRFGRIPAAAAG